MCDSCASSDTAPSLPRLRALKLVDIAPEWHCTILGTCLTLAELRSVAAKHRVQVVDGRNGYNLHAGMVKLASHDRAISKTLSKLLDRKHARILLRFARARDDAGLLALWDEAMAKGEVAGACWAMMSHGAATEELRGTVFQDVHMLSHLVGAAARADLRAIHQLQRDKADLEEKVSRQQDRLRDEIGERDHAIAELRQRLETEMAENRRLAHAAAVADDLERLRRQVVEGRCQAETECSRRAALAEELREARKTVQALTEKMAFLIEENSRLADDNRVYEARLGAGCGDGLGGCSEDCARLDLCGRCILCVGGQSGQMPHLRRLVEDSNGVFLHHDGGLEHSMSRLHGLFGRVDAVLFPVDAISHSAQDAVKQLCRRWDKPFVPVRRSGLGAYWRALSTLAESGEAKGSAS